METKWIMIMFAVSIFAVCMVGVVGVYSDGQSKIAHEQTIKACYDAAKTNSNIKCPEVK